ncbi:unnamed protein product [Rhizoctonia solani]|uniref:Protein kinase domain-containing protein n=1 Tax=Rhizoctonia solani TaxID=456999 RepID=A0A8H3B1Z6_9AGAM|nr:unnamed protein product [Rhizoctonia solani]
MSHIMHNRSRPVPIIRKGHTDLITSVAFSPDEKSVASGSEDMLIRIWDICRPSQRGRPFRGHTDSVMSVSYSPRGDIIASGSWDKTILIWDTNTRLPVCEPLEGHTHCVTSVAFSPDGKLIASASDDWTVRLWDVQKRASTSDPFEGHTSWVKSVVFSPDGSRIASCSADGAIRIWDAKHGRTVVGPLRGHFSAVESVIFSPDGTQLVSGSADTTLRLWDTRSRSIVGNPYEGHEGWVHSVSFSPNGLYVASGSCDRTVRVWDVRTGRQVVEPFEGHNNCIASVAFSPSGSQVASGSFDETVMVWSMSVYGSNAKNGSFPEPKVDKELAEDKNLELIPQYVSIRETFDLLLGCGCVNFASQMDIKQENAVLVPGGGFGDLWKGYLFNGTRVAIKVWRASLVEHCDYDTLKRATCEIHEWSKMEHHNVHAFMGVVLFQGQSLGMVLEWMENGNLHEYLRKSPNTDRYQLSIQVASGLAHIHSFDMVHGDIKAFNVLVSADGVAKLTNFGLSTMTESIFDVSATNCSQAGSVRWAAPELLLAEAVKGAESDIYALGMVCTVL